MEKKNTILSNLTELEMVHKAMNYFETVSKIDQENERPIYDWDTNYVFISEKLKSFDPVFHKNLTSLFEKMDIEYGYLPNTQDIWCRDYMPIQLNQNTFLGYKYDPDYLKFFSILLKIEIFTPIQIISIKNGMRKHGKIQKPTLRRFGMI